MHLVGWNSQLRRQWKNSLSESAARDRQVHSFRTQTCDCLSSARCDSLDVDATQLVELGLCGTDGLEALPVNLLERNQALHCLVGQLGAARFGGGAAERGEPVNTFQSGESRVDIEHNGIEPPHRMLPGASIPSGSSSRFTAVIIEIWRGFICSGSHLRLILPMPCSAATVPPSDSTTRSVSSITPSIVVTSPGSRARKFWCGCPFPA